MADLVKLPVVTTTTTFDLRWEVRPTSLATSSRVDLRVFLHCICHRLKAILGLSATKSTSAPPVSLARKRQPTTSSPISLARLAATSSRAIPFLYLLGDLSSST